MTENEHKRQIKMLLKIAKVFCSLHLLGFLTPVVATDDPGANYSIDEPESTFENANGQFSIKLLYNVGSAVGTSQTAATLYEKDCDGDATSDTVIAIVTKSVSGSQLEVKVNIAKENLGSSSLVDLEGGFGASKGTLNFCVRSETLTTDATPISVSFIDSNIALSYDLSNNDFKVEDNTVVKDVIKETDTEVVTNYKVDACRCSKDSSDCLTGTLPNLSQNGLVYVCLYPNSTDVKISNFNMKFEQDDDLGNHYEIVTLGTTEPESNSLTAITGDGTTTSRYKVVSRLITRLFESSDTTFDITGTAYLVFTATRRERRLVNVDANLRSDVSRELEEVPDAGSAAGEAPFDMNVSLNRPTTAVPKTSNTAVISLAVVGGCAALSIAFLLFKKFKK